MSNATFEMVEFLSELVESGALEIRSGSYTVDCKLAAMRDEAAALLAKGRQELDAFNAWVDEQAAMRADAKAMFVAGGAY